MKGRYLILIFLFLILFSVYPALGAVPNGGFETGSASSWTIGPSSGQGDHLIHADYAYSGNYGCQLTITPGERIYFYQNVDLTGKDYLSFRLKAVDLGGYSEFKVKVDGSWRYSKTSTSGTYTQIFIDVSGDTGSDMVLFELWNGTGEIWIDDWSTDQTPVSIDFYPADAASFESPEDIQLDTMVADYASDDFIYTVRLYGYLYGGWGALSQVEYNESTKIETLDKSIIVDIDDAHYDLPLYIKGVILQFDKSDYTTTEIAETNAVYYNIEQGDTEGVINFNQTYYTDPENIRVDWDITGYNTTFFNYEIQVITSISGNPSHDSWPADGNWNTSPFISSSSGAAVFDFYSDGYDLPIWVQGELWAQDKNTGTWTRLDSTPVVLYHEGTPVAGQIWTDKSNYNVTELVEISYTTNIAENYIAVEEPYSLWSVHDVLVGTYSFMYELSTSAVGNTTIYLFENSVLVDQVTISVSSESGDDAYAAWMKDYYYEGETASFYYYSSNTSAQITVYDGADIVVFGPATTQLGYHNGQVNTANTNPGTFLLSLYHNGTYYNDTMIFESVDSWVRFDSSKYYVGGTINIEYYLADSRHAISMWDAHQQKIGRFRASSGFLVTGSMQTFPFTLSENNEYSYDVPGKLASGELSLGYWAVHIEDEYGALGNSWDEAYVCEATDDDSSGPDASNEMISLFFSPEGIYLLFTACLTLAGLAVTKHPGGGAACAVVAVGFGVFFKVLPVWMLLLMVIALVVLAGVNIAVYFKGK